MYLLQISSDKGQREIAREAGMTDSQRKRVNEQIRDARESVAREYEATDAVE